MSLTTTAFVLAAPEGRDTVQTLLPFSEGGMTGGEFGREISFLILFILLNGFFVAAEFALVKLRDNQLDEPIEEGSRPAKLTRHILNHLDPYLSACQLGITIASIVLGAVSAPFISDFLQPFLVRTGMSEGAIFVTSWILAVSVITFLHVVIGEQLPKVFAIRRALRTSVIIARPLHWFYLILKLPVWILNSCSTWLLKVILRIDDSRSSHLQAAMSSTELRLLVEETGEAKEVTETEKEILMNALELNELTVRDIIVPRNQVVALDIHNSFEENLKVALATTHTRFPLVDGHLDDTEGLVHIKDLIREMQKEDPDIDAIKREITIVTELLPLDDMLRRFQRTKAHMALVVDEYGGSLGLAMLDDVLDQVVGDIHDEFDDGKDPRFHKVSDDEFLLRGDYPLHELDDKVEELVLESPEVSTIGGYITELLGHLPMVDETIEIKGFVAHVTESDEKSVKQVRLARIPKKVDETTDSDETNETE